MVDENTLIQALGVLCAVVVILGIFVWMPWLDHRRDMTLVRKGMYTPPRRKPLTTADIAKYAFLIGAIASGAGAALLIGSYEITGMETARWFRFSGLVVLFIGLAMVVSYLVLRGKEEKRR